jgi:hypothetical protein
MNLAGCWWTMVSGEYEDDIGTTLTHRECNTGRG